MTLKEDWRKEKEEVIIGAVAGMVGYFIFAKFNTSGINPLRTMAIQSQGLIDKLVILPPDNIATIKVMLTFVIFGAIVGLVIGKWFNPIKWGK